MSAPALEIESLSKSFGALQVTRNVDLRLGAGARHALIGPNGAGKTSLVNQITGTLTPTKGAIRLKGIEIIGLAREKRVRLGLVRTFQINALFLPLTVAENLRLAVLANKGLSFKLRFGSARRRDVEAAVVMLLETLQLSDLADVAVQDLAYGKRRLVEIALALALDPQVLLLDEPAAGLSRQESATLLRVLKKLPPHIALLIIEHDMALVFELAHEISVMVEGAILVSGRPEEVRSDARVRDVYLGRRHG